MCKIAKDRLCRIIRSSPPHSGEQDRQGRTCSGAAGSGQLETGLLVLRSIAEYFQNKSGVSLGECWFLVMI